jgi:hypothetical protein
VAALDFNLNDADEKDAEGGGGPVAPRGRYMLQIVEGDIKENSKGTGLLYEFKAEITEGEFQGTHVYERLNVRNTNATAQKIAQAQLKALTLACGLDPSTTTDTDHLLYQPFQADLDIERYTPKGKTEEKERNTFKRFIHAGNAETTPPGKDEPAANDNAKQNTTAANNNTPKTNPSTARSTGNAGTSATTTTPPWKRNAS